MKVLNWAENKRLHEYSFHKKDYGDIGLLLNVLWNTCYYSSRHKIQNYIVILDILI